MDNTLGLTEVRRITSSLRHITSTHSDACSETPSEPFYSNIAKPSKPQPLHEGWFQLLNEFHWQWYITHTFRESVHPERADKLWRVWCSKINRYLYGPRWHKKNKSVFWVRAIEYQRRDVIHFHGLMTGVESLNQFEWMDKWLNLDGEGVGEGLTGISRIYNIDKEEKTDAVIRYVSKYVVKGGEIDLSPNMPAYNKPLLKRSFTEK